MIDKESIEGVRKELIGRVCVDSAMLVICDPAHMRNITYEEATKPIIDGVSSHQLKFPNNANKGVAFSSGYGDGCYDVIATFNKDGRIVKIEIDMDNEETFNKLTGRKS